MPPGLNNIQRVNLIKSILNFDNEVQVRAAGGLLTVLQQEMLIEEAEIDDEESDGQKYVLIGDLCQFPLDQFLMLDAATYEALQIFQTEKHASSMGIGNSKEGFSVFGMSNKCVTQAGRKLLRTWFMRPIVKLEDIEQRQNAISAIKAAPEMMRALQDVLKHVKDIPKILQKLGCPSMLSGKKDWEQLQESSAYLIQLRELVEMAVFQAGIMAFRNLNITGKILEKISDEIRHVHDLITGVVDFDQVCRDSTDTFIAFGICNELDELKGIYEGLPDFLNTIAQSEWSGWPQEFRTQEEAKIASIEYLPQVGYLLRMEGSRAILDYIEDIPGIDFSFEGDDMMGHGCFYHTQKTRELDRVLGDVLHKIIDLENALLRDLEMRILEHSSSLCAASSVAAEIDCLVSLAMCAHENKYVKPTLTQENLLQITNGRHVLQEMTVGTFVPNSTAIGSDGRVCIITGPNYSGKSIYVKQVALIVFLSHIGAFVPADSATVGLTDRIFTRIANRDSIASGQSTFAMDLSQMSGMIRHATSRSLCIVDEFGKGTLTSDGFGLLCATVNHLASMPAPPKVFLCTHFCELPNSIHLSSSRNVSFSTMSVLEPKEGRIDDSNGLSQEIVFLYRLVPGQAGESFGLHCAQLAGVPSEIVLRAQKVLKNVKQGVPVERENNELTVRKDRNYKDLVEKLLELDCLTGDVHKFIQTVQMSSLTEE